MEVMPSKEEGRIDELKRGCTEAWATVKSGMPSTGRGWAEAFLPCLRWIRGYKWREWLVSDVLAGIAATIMTVPENISNAGLAGAPSKFGLYSSILPSFVYAMYGGCGQMAVGAVAITMLTLGDGIISIFGSLQSDPNNPEDPAAQDEINKAIIQVALLSGAMLFGLGFFRLGFLTNLMSYSVVAGYLAGAALLIIASQIKFLFGIHTQHASTIQAIIEQIKQNIDGFNWRDLVMGLSFTLTLILCKEIGIKWHKFWWLKAVGTLVCLVVGILVMNLAHLYEPEDNPRVDPLGSVDKGFPQCTISWWGPLVGDIGDLLITTVTTMLVMLIETICMARKLAQDHGTTVNANQELRAIGLVNFAAAAFSTVPTAGSISRAAVVNSANGKTPLSGFVTGIVVLIITVFFTGVFTNMPDNLTGAIMISAVYRVLNPMELLYCWKVSLFDFLLYITTFCVVIFAGVYWGMLAGVALAIAVHVYRTSHPPMAVLGRLPGTNSYRDTSMFPEAEEDEGVLMLRVHAGLFFANTVPIKKWVMQQVVEADARFARRGEALAYVVLDISATQHVDADTVQMLKTLTAELAGMGVRAVLVNQSVRLLRALGKRDLDATPHVDGEELEPKHRHHFGNLQSALHVEGRKQAAAAAAEAGAKAPASAVFSRSSTLSVYEGQGEMFQDPVAALQHCSSMVHTFGLSKRHSTMVFSMQRGQGLTTVAEEAVATAAAAAGGDSKAGKEAEDEV